MLFGILYCCVEKGADGVHRIETAAAVRALCSERHGFHLPLFTQLVKVSAGKPEQGPGFGVADKLGTDNLDGSDGDGVGCEVMRSREGVPDLLLMTASHLMTSQAYR
jgi:hypothetical protein